LKEIDSHPRESEERLSMEFAAPQVTRCTDFSMRARREEFLLQALCAHRLHLSVGEFLTGPGIFRLMCFRIDVKGEIKPFKIQKVKDQVQLSEKAQWTL
jgi:hypothetical protein